MELCVHVCLCRLLEENRRHQELILGICAEKDNMRDELKKRAETEKLHMSTMQKVCSSPRQVYSHCSQSQTNRLCVSFICSVYTCFSFSDCKHVEDGLWIVNIRAAKFQSLHFQFYFSCLRKKWSAVHCDCVEEENKQGNICCCVAPATKTLNQLKQESGRSLRESNKAAWSEEGKKEQISNIHYVTCVYALNRLDFSEWMTVCTPIQTICTSWIHIFYSQSLFPRHGTLIHFRFRSERCFGQTKGKKGTFMTRIHLCVTLLPSHHWLRLYSMASTSIAQHFYI